MHLKSKITYENKKRALLFGLPFATCGLLILVGGALFIPFHVLEKWGGLIGLFGISLTTIALLPYRRLCTLEKYPVELVLDKTAMAMATRGRLRLSIPFASIAAIDEKKNGLGVKLKGEVNLIDQLFSFKRFQRRSLKRTGYDLFLPYIKREACLQDIVQMNQAD